MKRTIRISEGIEFNAIGGHVKRLVHPITTGSVNMGVSICYLLPGEEVTYHSHNYEEAYFVIEGEGEMILEGEAIHLVPNLSVYIPSNAMHGQKNTSDKIMAIVCSLSPAPTI